MSFVTLKTAAGKVFRWHGRSVMSETVQVGRDARTDWRIVCITFLLLNLISFVGNVFVYRQINKGEIFLLPKREPGSLRMPDRLELKAVVDFFNLKKKQFDSLEKDPLVIADPGVPSTKK